jgi:OCT family organic cation transporter-like MFS transporter 4/5
MIEKSNVAPSAVEKLLGCGRFQGLTFLCYQWIVFVQAWNMVFMVFGKSMPTRWSFENENSNTTIYGNGTGNLFSCECLQSKNGCKNFTWSSDFYSIVPHWQLVCDRVKIIYFIMTIQMIGVFIGSPIFGQISDSFGRKWTLFGSVAMLIFFGTISAFSPNWQTFAALRFLVGFCLGGTITTAHVILVEMLSQKHRLWVSSIAGWPAAYALLSFLAYVTADWRILAIVTNLAGLPALALILFVGESPRWLLQKGKSNLADFQLRRIVRINRDQLDEKILLTVIDNSQIQKEMTKGDFFEKAPLTPAEKNPKSVPRKYTYWHLFTTKSMAIHTIVLAICYFCTSNVSNGILFNVDKLSGNLFLNFFLLACLRWISNAVTIAADLIFSKFGRKIGFVFPFSLIAIASAIIVTLFIAGQNLVNFHTIISIASLIIAMLCSPVWAMLLLSTSENYPTPIRNIAAAFTATFNRLGSVVVPQFLYLGHFWSPSPYLVFTIFSLIAAVLYGLFVPETKGIPLPDAMPVRERLRSLSIRRDSIAVYQPIKNEFLFVDEESKK